MEQQLSTSFSLLLPVSSPIKRNNRSQTSTPARSLHEIIAENEIRQQNLDYQRLLIRSKELQIQKDSIMNEYQALIKKRKKAEKGVQQIQLRRDQALMQSKQKQCYLQKYYQQLDRKFRGGREELFNSLSKLQNNLTEMYHRDQKRLKESLKSQEEEFNKLVSLVNNQQERRNQLRDQVAKLEGQHYLNPRREKAEKLGQQEEMKSQNYFLKTEIDRMAREKKTLETDQKILKKILNIEEEHRKHSVIIENGIRKMFQIKLKQQRYKQAVSMDYSKNMQSLQAIISKRKQDKNTLTADIIDKKKRLSQLMQEVHQKNQEYGQLEDEHIRSQRS